jgi:hypothetical protein
MQPAPVTLKAMADGLPDQEIQILGKNGNNR